MKDSNVILLEKIGYHACIVVALCLMILAIGHSFVEGELFVSFDQSSPLFKGLMLATIGVLVVIGLFWRVLDLEEELSEANGTATEKGPNTIEVKLLTFEE